MTLTDQIKSTAKAMLPRPMQAAGRYLLDPAERARHRIRQALATPDGFVVKAGPFKGMKYVDRAAGSEFLPKIIGSYEKELDPTLPAIAGKFDTLIDIGAAEGYYAVGLLRQHPSIQSLAFEANAKARVLLNRMADLNGVADRLTIAGLCTPDLLNAALAQADRPFVLCDCEGAEFELLDPAKVPALAEAALLIELHGHVDCSPGDFPDHPTALDHCLQNRFRPTHRIQSIAISPRTASDWPESLASVGTPAERLAAMDEHRWPGSRGWLYLEPLVLAI